jgi:ABC-type lipoprotein release transport system permease subunit
VSIAAGRVLNTLVFDVSPADPISLTAAAGTLLVVALLATYVPMKRALDVNPMQILRSE